MPHPRYPIPKIREANFSYLTKTISDNLQNDEFINIIIPTCFGKILSDFLGLRFATHIRCTPGINQHANIFLYSFTGIQDYNTNECFNIIRTKGVFLIDYNKQIVELINDFSFFENCGGDAGIKFNGICEFLQLYGSGHKLICYYKVRKSF